MSKKEIPKLSAAQRVEYATKVKTLRQDAGLTQQEVADAAGISRATLIGLEKGDTAPQSDNLLKVLRVFGIFIDEQRFQDETELWLSMMGALIEAIPSDRRGATVERAMRVLTDGVRGGAVVSPFHKNGSPVDLQTVDLDEYDQAAGNHYDDGEPDIP
jgi:transcriptional regulator with XRE-family HTH domain